MLKRLADWLEKVSVASFAVGVYQNRVLGIVISACTLVASVYLPIWAGTKKDGDKC